MRKRKLTKTVQFEFIKLILIAILFPTVLLVSCFYFFINLLISKGVLVPSVDYSQLGTDFQVIVYVLFFGFGIISAIIIALSLSVSNRMAGALYRLERDLESFLGGDRKVKFDFRKGDELENLSALLVRLTDKIKEMERKGFS